MDCQTLLQATSVSLTYPHFRMSPQEFDARMHRVEEALLIWGENPIEGEFVDAYARGEAALLRLRKVYYSLLSGENNEDTHKPRTLTVGLSRELDLLRRMASMDRRMREFPLFTGIAMLPHHEIRDRDRGFLRLNRQQAQVYRVQIQDGRLFDSKGRPLHTGDGADAIFVLSVEGELYLKTHPRRGFFHHSTFLDGGFVAAAGKFRLDRGRVLLISDHSGHYAAPRVLTAQLIHYLVQEGVDLSETDFEFLSPYESSPSQSAPEFKLQFP